MFDVRGEAEIEIEIEIGRHEKLIFFCIHVLATHSVLLIGDKRNKKKHYVYYVYVFNHIVDTTSLLFFLFPRSAVSTII